MDAARDRRLFRDDSDTLPVEVLEEGHKRRYEGGLVAGNRTHERWVRLFVRCEVAEPASRVSREGGGERSEGRGRERGEVVRAQELTYPALAEKTT